MAGTSPDRQAWLRQTIAQIAPRLEQIRAAAGRGPANVARTLAGIVARFEAELVDAPAEPEPAINPELAKLERSLADIQPRPGPHGLVINGGDMMDRVRHQLACRIAELRGAPAPAAPAPPVATIAIELPPVAEAVPFSAGPQLDLFGIAA